MKDSNQSLHVCERCGSESDNTLTEQIGELYVCNVCFRKHQRDMQPGKQLIRDNSTGAFVDGFDGNSYEWTFEHKTAQQFDKHAAKTAATLANVRKAHPHAVLVSTDRKCNCPSGAWNPTCPLHVTDWKSPAKVKQTLANRIAEKVTALVIDPKKQTFIVIGPTYYGVAANLIDAATNCAKAHCPKSAMVAVVQIVGDDAATFNQVGLVEYASGAVLVNLGTFKLGHLVAGRATRV